MWSNSEVSGVLLQPGKRQCSSRTRRKSRKAFEGVAEPMRDVWIAVRASLRGVLEQVTLADVISGELPANVRTLVADEDAWVPH